MKAPLPPNFRKPAWSTPGFRRLLIAAVLGVAVLAVLIVDIGPKLRDIMEHKKVAATAPKLTGPDVFVPRAPGDTSQPTLLPYEGIPAKAKDGTPIELNEEPYVYLLKNLSKVDESALSKDAKRVDYAYFGQVPEQLKGQSVKVMGLFLQSNPIRLETKVNDVEWIYRTYLTDMRGQEGYVVDLLERPTTLKRRAVVTTNALFLKLGTYEGQKGQVQAPFLVGKSLQQVHETIGEASNAGTLLVAIAVGAVLLVVFLTVRIGSRPRPKNGDAGLETAKV